jgi:putative SOS response-associated peptidase YedK
MCGRFTLTVDPADLQVAFPQCTFPAESKPRFNIAPTQPVLALPNQNEFVADYFTWGLIPFWAKDPGIGSQLINARAETLAEKPAFRGSYKYKRCLIFADGFYEWKAQPETKFKIPHFIRLTSGQPFAFAGLWEEWRAPDGSFIKSCAIITTEPNQLLATLHNRMPVILPPTAYEQWLDPTPQRPEQLQALLTQYPADRMSAYPVSTLVNSPANDRAELVVPV